MRLHCHAATAIALPAQPTVSHTDEPRADEQRLRLRRLPRAAMQHPNLIDPPVNSFHPNPGSNGAPAIRNMADHGDFPTTPARNWNTLTNLIGNLKSYCEHATWVLHAALLGYRGQRFNDIRALPASAFIEAIGTIARNYYHVSPATVSALKTAYVFFNKTGPPNESAKSRSAEPPGAPDLLQRLLGVTGGAGQSAAASSSQPPHETRYLLVLLVILRGNTPLGVLIANAACCCDIVATFERTGPPTALPRKLHLMYVCEGPTCMTSKRHSKILFVATSKTIPMAFSSACSSCSIATARSVRRDNSA